VTDPCQKEISQLLRAWSQGDEAALESLTPLVYEELHRLAKYYMARERPDHILQTTALVNEVAEVMNLSPVTVAREWSKAKAWLLRELEA
jgi:hypothetical protein